MKGEEVYAQALLEIQECRMQPALWAHAQANANGDGNVAMSHYILFRVQQSIGSGPSMQVMLHGGVHNPQHGVRMVSAEAANNGGVSCVEARPFLRQAGARSAFRAAQMPVWANPDGAETLPAGGRPWLRMAPNHALAKHHSPVRTNAALRRFVIRGADLSIIGGLLLALLVALTPAHNFLPTFFTGLFGLQLQAGSNAAGLFAWLVNGSLLLLLLPATLCLEAGIHALFGTTPGKVLGGVELITPNGALTSKAYFLRNCQLWLNGFALGVLPISFVALVWQFLRVARGRDASYDHAESLCVRLRHVSRVRVAALYLLFCAGGLTSLGMGGLMFDLW
jgi:hypothetical protein